MLLSSVALLSCSVPTEAVPSPTPATLPDYRISFWVDHNDGSNQYVQYSSRVDGTDVREDARGQIPEESTQHLEAPNGRWIAQIDESRVTVLATGENPTTDTRELPVLSPIHSLDWSSSSRYLSYSAARTGDIETDTVYVYNMETHDLLQIGDADGLDNFRQTWSSSGDRLAYVAGDARQGCVVGSVVVVLDLPSGTHLKAIPEADITCTPAWSPVDNRLALAAKLTTDNDLEMYVVSEESPAPIRVSQLPSDDCCASFSPDGRYLAFLALGTGTSKVYIADLATNKSWRLSTFGDEVGESRIAWVP